MKVKIIASYPVEGQDGIEYLIGEVFETVPETDFDKDIRKEMKETGEVAIKIGGLEKWNQFILNKNEYIVVD